MNERMNEKRQRKSVTTTKEQIIIGLKMWTKMNENERKNGPKRIAKMKKPKFYNFRLNNTSFSIHSFIHSILFFSFEFSPFCILYLFELLKEMEKKINLCMIMMMTMMLSSSIWSLWLIIIFWPDDR